MTSFSWKKNIEDSLRDGLIIIIGATAVFFGLKATNVKPPRAAFDAMDIIKLNRWDLRRCLSKRLCSLQKMDQRVIQQQKFYDL